MVLIKGKMELGVSSLLLRPVHKILNDFSKQFPIDVEKCVYYIVQLWHFPFGMYLIPTMCAIRHSYLSAKHINTMNGTGRVELEKQFAYTLKEWLLLLNWWLTPPCCIRLDGHSMSYTFIWIMYVIWHQYLITYASHELWNVMGADSQLAKGI